MGDGDHHAPLEEKQRREPPEVERRNWLHRILTGAGATVALLTALCASLIGRTIQNPFHVLAFSAAFVLIFLGVPQKWLFAPLPMGSRRRRQMIGRFVVGAILVLLAGGAVWKTLEINPPIPTSNTPPNAVTASPKPAPTPRTARVLDRCGETRFVPCLLLPKDWRSVSATAVVGDVLYTGGRGADGSGRFGELNLATRRFVDDSPSLPASFANIKAISPGNGATMAVGAISAAQSTAFGEFDRNTAQFNDLSLQMQASVPFRWWLNSVAFNGNDYLVGGASLSFTPLVRRRGDSLMFQSLTAALPIYFATNTIVPDGPSFLMVGAGPGRSPTSPPALGWIRADGSFADESAAVPQTFSQLEQSAFDGRIFLIDGVNRGTGELAFGLFDAEENTFADVSDSLSARGLSVARIVSTAQGFVIAGRMGDGAYVMTYSPKSGLIRSLRQVLPGQMAAITEAALWRGRLILIGPAG